MCQRLKRAGSSKGGAEMYRSVRKAEGHPPSLRKCNRSNLFVSKTEEDRQPMEDGLRNDHRLGEGRLSCCFASPSQEHDLSVAPLQPSWYITDSQELGE